MTAAITTAMVLAAGMGTRLRPLTNHLPKPLCEVGGVPLIRLALRQLHAAGVTRAVINLHHLGPAIQAALGPTAEGVSLLYSPESTILGTGGGIRAALPLLGNGPFFVINADALHDVDLTLLGQQHLASGAVATLALREDPNAARFGLIGTDTHGRIHRMVDRFDDGLATRFFMFTGIHAMDARVVEHLPLGQESCVIRQGYVPQLQAGHHLHAFIHTGAFHDVGTPDRWAAAQKRVLLGEDAGLHRLVTQGLEQRAPNVWVHHAASVHASAVLLPPVVIQARASVEAGATVGPHVALGQDAKVVAGGTCSHSAVLAGAVAQGTLDGVVVAQGEGLPWPWP